MGIRFLICSTASTVSKLLNLTPRTLTHVLPFLIINLPILIFIGIIHQFQEVADDGSFDLVWPIHHLVGQSMVRR